MLSFGEWFVVFCGTVGTLMSVVGLVLLVGWALSSLSE